MNKHNFVALMSVLILFTPILISQKLPFNRGVNITEWFQTNSAKEIQFTKYTHEDFVQLKSLGVDVVRLPINLHFMTSGAPNYTLDPLFIFFLDQVVDWVEELDMNLILDNHTFDVTQSTSTDIDQVLIPVWTQIATHFKNRTNKIFYEVLNEPHGITDVRWNQIQQSVVTAIRTVDQSHTIVIGPAGWNSYNNLAAMPVYSDTNLIYTFHFYDPFLFTHQGASWTDPSMGPLSGVPFPYDASRMPSCPTTLKGTWIESSLNNYRNEGTVQKVHSWLDIAINFRNSRNVPIYCGEFGVFIPNSPENDRVVWYDSVRSYLEQNKVAWTIWDYRGGFGVYEKNSNELFQYDLNIPMLNALGFNVPPQSEYVQLPDTVGFDFYNDFIGNKITGASYNSGILDFYNEENPFYGKYCIYWNGAKQYNNIAFDFRPNKDLSVLRTEDYVFDCMVKCNIPYTSFDIRFIDTKTNDPSDHPWRMGCKVNRSRIVFTNEWQNLRIPLKDFYELGSWDNAWYDPIGLFDWENIDRFEIVAEDSALTTSKLWFDNIKIFNPNLIGVEKDNSIPYSIGLEQNYPNPFNPSTIISYKIPFKSIVSLKVYDMLGREIEVLVQGMKNAGKYELSFSPSIKSSGIYFVRFIATTIDGQNQFVQTRKMQLIK
jgi:endoglucanase